MTKTISHQEVTAALRRFGKRARRVSRGRVRLGYNVRQMNAKWVGVLTNDVTRVAEYRHLLHASGFKTQHQHDMAPDAIFVTK